MNIKLLGDLVYRRAYLRSLGQSGRETSRCEILLLALKAISEHQLGGIQAAETLGPAPDYL